MVALSLIPKRSRWSRSQRNVLLFEPKNLNLSELAQKSIEPLLEMAKNKNIRVETSIDDELMIFADSDMIQTVIRNLFSNAVKFTRKQGKIHISARKKDNEFVEINIQDTGIGMDKDLLKNLFNVSISTSRRGTEGEVSSGLGLILCNEFVKKNGGKLWVESKIGEGSVFYFTLPVKPLPDSAPEKNS